MRGHSLVVVFVGLTLSFTLGCQERLDDPETPPPLPPKADGLGPSTGGDHHPFEGPLPDASGTRGVYHWRGEVSWPNASYIAIHFVDFDLGAGDVLRVSSPDGSQGYQLRGRGKMQAGTFWAST